MKVCCPLLHSRYQLMMTSPDHPFYWVQARSLKSNSFNLSMTQRSCFSMSKVHTASGCVKLNSIISHWRCRGGTQANSSWMKVHIHVQFWYNNIHCTITLAVGVRVSAHCNCLGSGLLYRRLNLFAPLPTTSCSHAWLLARLTFCFRASPLSWLTLPCHASPIARLTLCCPHRCSQG